MGLSREFLKGLELDKSTIDAIMAEYGSGVTELKEEIIALKEKNANMKKDSDELATLQKDFKELEKAKKDLEKQNSELASQKTELEANNANSLKAIKKEYAIKKAILKSAPIDDVSYRAHLDDSKIEYDEEKDSLVGFEEQDKAIKENYAFLFNQGATGGEHGDIKNGGDGLLSIEDAINQTM